jgi:FKBP12-rapamycin complex-associated protein
MDSKYESTSEMIFKMREHKDTLIRRAVVELASTLAVYNPEIFVGAYLNNYMVHLIGQLRKDKDRAAVFVAIGKVAIAVGSHIAMYLDAVLSSIKESLSTRGKMRVTAEAQIFECISMLAKAVGPALTKYMHELLDQMFQTGLTESLRQALVDLSMYIPPLLPTIQGLCFVHISFLAQFNM